MPCRGAWRGYLDVRVAVRVEGSREGREEKKNDGNSVTDKERK